MSYYAALFVPLCAICPFYIFSEYKCACTQWPTVIVWPWVFNSHKFMRYFLPSNCFTSISLFCSEFPSNRKERQYWGHFASKKVMKDEIINILKNIKEGRQSTVRGSMVNSEAINNQHCWLLILGGGGGGINSQQWESQWSTVRGSTQHFTMGISWCIMGNPLYIKT